ncbi:Tip elongation aberrant protein 1 [Erysiphe necator]|nr:Tip elongation aberrant protein 1 [Erysiphe necator]
MAFLFKSKKNADKIQFTKDGPRAAVISPSTQQSTNSRSNEKSGGFSTTPGTSVNNSITSLQGGVQQGQPSPDQVNIRRGLSSEQAQEFSLRNGNTPVAQPMASSPNPSLYPWSQVRITFSTGPPGPFPRYGAAVNSVASKDGGIYLMGGLVNGSSVKGDLWMVEAVGNMACYPLTTTAEGPSPRVGHASLLVGNAFIVYGGDTKMDDSDVLDETLYLLNTSTRQWSRAIPAGPRPAGRYGHSLNILGSKIYVFGGQVEGYFMNDLVAFDLNLLQVPTNRWEILIKNSEDGGPPVGQIPSARTNHSVVTYNEKLYLFGGTNGLQWYNDVWCYDPIPNSWTLLDCIGYIPVPREGHAAAIVDDVMYVFGGRADDGSDLGDLAAFRITSRRWYTFQNMGQSPSARSGHCMTAHGKQIVVIGGEPNTLPREIGDLAIAYLLDTSKIRYPNDHNTQQLPDRVIGGRRPSVTDKPNLATSRGLASRDAPIIDTKRANGIIGRGNGQLSLSGNELNGAVSSPGLQAQVSQGKSGSSKLPRAAGIQGSSGNSTLEQAPPPRSNSATPTASGRSKYHARYEVGHSSSVDISGRSLDENLSTSSSRGLLMSPVSKDISKESPSSNERINTVSQSLSATKPTTNGNAPPVSLKNAGSGSSRSSSRNRFNHRQGSSDTTSDHASFRNASGTRPTSPPPSNRQVNNPLVRRGSARNSQTVSILKELDAAKNRNVWYASELALARKAGYTPSSSSSFDQQTLDSFDDEDRSLIEALIAMKTEIVNVQGSIDQQTILAARKIAEVEKQRDSAIKEAVYAKAKLASCNINQAITPSPDGESQDLDKISNSRSEDLTKRLASVLADQAELQKKNESLNSELEAEKRTRKLAEEVASSSQIRISELETYKQHNSVEIERLKSEFHELQVSSRKESIECAQALSSAQILQVEKEELQVKYQNVLSSSQINQETFQSLRNAIDSSVEMRYVLQRQLDDERGQREIVEAKLSRLRTEHEDCTSELEITTRKLREVEELLEAHSKEAKSNWQSIKSGLELMMSRENESSADTTNDQKTVALQSQIEAANNMVRKYQIAADSASEKLRSAEERIAGLEAYQEQASREGMSIRKQLQTTIKEIQTLQALNTDLKYQIENQQLETNAVNVQHNTLKDILEERGIRTSSSSRARGHSSPQSVSDTPDVNQVRELEQQLSASIASHEETKSIYEAREQEVERAYREKLSQLDKDYQTAVNYVKGTEKMLKRLNDELARFKVDNIRLKDQVTEAEKRAIAINGPIGWEEERAELQWRNESLQEEIKNSVKQLEQKISEVRKELISTEQERDGLKHDQEETQRRAQSEVAQLQKENTLLQQRVKDAEQKVSLLLDQVEQSVDIYRRHSRPVDLNGAAPSANSNSIYQRSLLTTDSASETSFDGGNRNSMALDSLASELETLRSNWQITNKNYRLSNAFDIEDITTTMKS